MESKSQNNSLDRLRDRMRILNDLLLRIRNRAENLESLTVHHPSSPTPGKAEDRPSPPLLEELHDILSLSQSIAESTMKTLDMTWQCMFTGEKEKARAN